MKSQARKKRLKMEKAKFEAVQESRNNNPNIMAIYSAFLPDFSGRRAPKFFTDKYGNRVRYVSQVSQDDEAEI